MGLICDKCEEFVIACEGEWEESVVCKRCGTPATSEEIVNALHRVAEFEAKLKEINDNNKTARITTTKQTTAVFLIFLTLFYISLFFCCIDII